jgi:hypothetical protein
MLTPSSSDNHLLVMEDILRFYIENHPDGLETCKPFLVDMQELIEEYQALLTLFYEHSQRQAILIHWLVSSCSI